jgi:dipeptidyl-peptidase-4
MFKKDSRSTDPNGRPDQTMHKLAVGLPTKSKLVLLVFSVLMVGSTTIVAQKQLTVEAIYSRELQGSLQRRIQWVPDGSGFTYVQADPENPRHLNIWRHDLKSQKRQVLVSSKEVSALSEPRQEKRFTLNSYFWSPDGKSILIPSPNDLYLYDLAGKRTRQLTNDRAEERDPTFSPDSRRIAFLKNHNLHVLDIASGQSTRLTTEGEEHILSGRFDWVYEEEFSIRTGFYWSPDSRYIAYFMLDERHVNEFPLVDFIPVHNKYEPMRYPKAGDANAYVKIGIVAVDGTNGVTRWMDIGAETDIYIPRIKWLKDGKHLAIIRLNRDQNHLELLVADIANGQTRLLLEENETNGWIDINDDWQLLDDGRHFVWLSMAGKGGNAVAHEWPHLYLYDLQGMLVRQITSGNWEVSNVAGVDEKNKNIYFTGTRQSHLERHLYKIKFDGSGLQQLTTRPGWHSINLSKDCKYFIDQFSNLTTPTQAILHANDGQIVEAIAANDIPALNEYHLGAPEFGTFTTPEGDVLHYWMLKPVDFDASKKYPVLMHVYGGPGSQTVVNRWGGSTGLWHQILAQKGYIIVSVDNRGTGGRGKNFMMQTYKNLGELEVKDQIHAAQWLANLPYVEASRIGIWGWSYGGYMAAFCILKGNEIFKTAVSVAPVTDWRNYDTIYTERYMLTPQKNPEGYDRTAPVKFAKELKGNLLLVHGANDDNVHLSNTLQLAMALQEARKPFSLMIYPQKDHGISGQDTRIHLFNMITDYLVKNL